MLESSLQLRLASASGSRSSDPLLLLLVALLLLTIPNLLSLPFIDQAHGQQQSVATATCIKYPGNPVLVPGSLTSWDNAEVLSPSVLYNGTATTGFVMFYTGVYNGSLEEIGLATSADGVRWVKYANPVLEPGKQGSWDSSAVYTPSVIWNGSEYMMYYTGFNLTTPASIGVAFSKDMIHWQEYANNPVLRPGPGIYDNVSVVEPSVMYDQHVYKMWYSGRYQGNFTHSIGYATSSDGVHWTKYAGNPVMTRGTTYDKYLFGPTTPSVVKFDPTTYLAAFETDGSIQYAISPDGVHWNSTAIPLLRSENSTSSPEYVIAYPSLIPRNSTLYLWYTREPLDVSQPVTIGFSFCTIGPAISTTTITAISPTTTTLLQTSISTTTLVSESTILQTSTTTTTEQATLPASPIYEVSTAILGVLLAAVVVMVLMRGIRRVDSDS